MANTRTKSVTEITRLDNNFNRKYAISVGEPPNLQLNRLEKILCEENFFDNIQYLFQSSHELVNSVRLYPFSIPDFAVMQDDGELSRYIPIGRISGSDVQCNGLAIKGVKNNVLIAEFYLGRPFGFWSYYPYTRMKIFLPYLGYYDLPVNEIFRDNVNDAHIEVRYSIDFDTGMCTAYVVNESLNYVILTTSGKIGVDIPIGSTNANEVAKNILSSSVSLAGGLLTTLVGGAVGGGIGAVVGLSGGVKAVTGATNMLTGSTIHYDNGVLHGGSSNMASPNQCFIIKTNRTILGNMSEFNKTYGRPLHQTYTLSQLHGFTKVGEIHLENFVDATDTEINEIETLLKSGVIL